MILVDTSVWVDHLRRGDARLLSLLDDDKVCCHPFVIAEISLGNLKNRADVIDSLRALEQAVVASETEFHALVQAHKLSGRGLGFVDVHLLASARLTSGARLWTRDKHLHDIAAAMELASA